jgi:hypothetical protein
MKKVKWRPRIAAAVVDTKPPIVVLWVKDQCETIVDLSYELVGFCGHQGEGLEAATVRPLPRVQMRRRQRGRALWW